MPALATASVVRDLLLHRLRNQDPAHARIRDPAELVGRVGAIQAQDYAARNGPSNIEHDALLA